MMVMIKSTGMVRRIDELGRIVIPVEIRRNIGVEERGALEIMVDGDKIVLKPYKPTCIFCDSADNILKYKKKNVCKNCFLEIYKYASR
jgi:transcriptional pleiotropic regulator of transition state genes